MGIKRLANNLLKFNFHFQHLLKKLFSYSTRVACSIFTVVKMIVTFLLLFFSVLPLAKSVSPVIVNYTGQLEELLCDYQHEPHGCDVVLHLDTSVTHEITSGNFCNVNISNSSLTITSISDTLALIKCMPNNETQYDKYWTRGFAFYGSSSSVTLSGLKFINCGTNLTTLGSNISIINSTSSPIHFTQYHAAVLVLADIAHLVVENLNIINYTGFGLIAVNLPDASFNHLNISHSQNYVLAAFRRISIGSGMLVLFCNHSKSSALSVDSKYDLRVNNSIFEYNFAFNQYVSNNRIVCVSEIRHDFFSSMPVIHAAGFTILYTQTDLPATVTIASSSLSNNVGCLAAALLLVCFTSSYDSQTVINDSQFTNNSMIMGYCHGAAIVGSFYFDNSNPNSEYKPLTVSNTLFSHNGIQFTKHLPQSSGAIDLKVIRGGNEINGLLPNVTFLFHSSNFTRNNAQKSGACIYAAVFVYHFIEQTKSNVHFIMESIVAYHNPSPTFVKSSSKVYIPIDLFHFSNINFVTVNGSTSKPGTFFQNYGTVFTAIDSKFILEGTLFFHSNIADHGTALALLGNSQVYLKEGLSATFENNTALSLGGAIYATGDSFLRQPCTFQLYSNNFNFYRPNILLKFMNNTSKLGGGSIYSTRLYHCFLRNASMFVNSTTNGKKDIIYNHIFNHSSKEITSLAYFTTICSTETIYYTHPGKTIQVPINVTDKSGSPTYAVVTVAAFEKKSALKPIVGWWFSDNQESFIIKGKTNCTIMNLTIHSRQDSVNKSSIILITVIEKNQFTSISVIMRKCPFGFYLNETTGTCLCSEIFDKLEYIRDRGIQCHIENKTFSKPSNLNLWVGNCSGTFCLMYCTSNYCNIGTQFDTLFINDTGSYLNSTISSETIPLCDGSRTGNLCGECILGHSVVFGSNECKICSSRWWLLTSILYIIIGPLIIFLLYSLNLTLTTGTLNGVIFYAQIANIGISNYFNNPCYDCSKDIHYLKLSIVFLSWLNLNLGFPLCFCDGMNELWKAGLSLLFPVYLVFLAGFIIILSHISSKVSNRLSKSSVQVLVTVLHLSFTKLTQAVLDVFCSTRILFEDGSSKLVWYSSGTVEYGSNGHKILIIVTLVVVGFFLVPYMAIILFGWHLMKFDRLREKIRPFYEAIHAPYKMKKRYWFALHQLSVLIAYATETISGGKDMPLIMFLSLLFLFHIMLACQSHAMPFKNKILNVLNIGLLLNLNVLFLTSVFLLLSEAPKKLTIFFSLANYPVIVVFFFIIVYHILKATNKLKHVILLYHKTCHVFLSIGKVKQSREAEYNSDFLDTGDYSRAREPLLEHIN